MVRVNCQFSFALQCATIPRRPQKLIPKSHDNERIIFFAQMWSFIKADAATLQRFVDIVVLHGALNEMNFYSVKAEADLVGRLWELYCEVCQSAPLGERVEMQERYAEIRERWLEDSDDDFYLDLAACVSVNCTGARLEYYSGDSEIFHSAHDADPNADFLTSQDDAWLVGDVVRNLAAELVSEPFYECDYTVRIVVELGTGAKKKKSPIGSAELSRAIAADPDAWVPAIRPELADLLEPHITSSCTDPLEETIFMHFFARIKTTLM